MTHTVALMDVSPAAHAEIEKALRTAGYDHAIEHGVLDMSGLALVCAAAPAQAARDPGFARPANYDTVSDTPALAMAMGLERHIVAMQAAVIDAHRCGPEVGMEWIVNTLLGPGLLPDDELDAQAYFDLHAPSIDACAFTSAATTAAPRSAAPRWSQAAQDVLAERRRQVEVEGWTEQHDDEHGDRSMAIAAACYAIADHNGIRVTTVDVVKLWEWTGWLRSWFKPKDRRSNLVRAGALVLAEIERLDRATPKDSQ